MRIVFLLILLAQIPFSVLAEEIYVPPELEPWVPWVEQENPNWNCAWANKNSYCVFPGKLSYEISKKRAEFAIEAELLAKGKIIVPSSAQLVPQRLTTRTLSGKTVHPKTRKNKKGELEISLPSGQYQVTGFFEYESVPNDFPIPEEIGIWSIESELGSDKFKRVGKSLVIVSDENENQVDSLNVKVFRKVIDGSPLRMTTVLQLSISGSSRPLEIASILPKQAVPTSIESGLSYYLNSKGKLALQLAPGKHAVVINSVLQQPVEEIVLPKLRFKQVNKEETVEREIIVFKDQPQFRSVKISGPKATAESAFELPHQVKGGAVYLALPASTIKLDEVRRGMLKPGENSLNISRNLWVDLKGQGFTAVDTISGQMNKNFRLNALPETKLGRADSQGKPQLITQDPKSKAWGLEIDKRNFSLQTVSRYEETSRIPATGWDAEANSFALNLNLPPSWKLITVLGASYASNAWIDSWTLLQIFLCFLIIIASYKLVGMTFSLLIGLCIVLNHGEFLAPQMLFIHLLLLIAWDKLISDRSSIYSTICDILLVTTFLVLAAHTFSFAKLQFTQFLFPQLQAGTRYRSFLQEMFYALDSAPFVWPAMIFYIGLIILWLTKFSSLQGFKKKFVCTFRYGVIGFILAPIVVALFSVSTSTGRIPSKEFAVQSSISQSAGVASPAKPKARGKSFLSEMDYSLRDEVDLESKSKKNNVNSLNRNLASGPAIPNWSWRSHYIQVDTPVASEHSLKIVTLSHSTVRVICALRVLLILYVLFMLFKKIFKKDDEFFSSIFKKSIALKSGLTTSCFALLVFPLLVFFNPGIAQADIPDAQTLKSLAKVLESSICKNKECASIESLKVSISEDTFRLRLEANSEGKTLITLPGPSNVLVPEVVTINGVKTNSVIGSNQHLLVGISKGKNLIEVTGRTPSSNAFSLSLPEKPIHVSVDSSYWYVEGVSKTGSIKGDLRFTAISDSSNKNPGLSSQNQQESKKIDLPAYGIVTRNIFISEEILIRTKVQLLGERSREKTLSVPILENEKITSGKLKVNGSVLNLSFAPNEAVKEYTSLIDRPEGDWSIKASSLPNLTEKWGVSCNTMLNCSFSGLKPTKNSIDQKIVRLFEPFSRETIAVKIVELETIKGKFSTIDSVQHDLKWGTGLTTGDVAITTRVTEQSNLKFEFEEGFRIKNIVSNDNGARGVFENNKGEILLSPGIHNVRLSYKSSTKPSFYQRLPALKINSDASNVNINLNPGAQRWILWTGGPLWGPSVIFWSKLIVFLVICITLSRLNLIPLSIRSASFLGLGLASLPVIRFWVPLVWLVSLVLLDRYRDKISSRFTKVTTAAFCLLVTVSLFVLYEIVMSGLVLKPPMLIIGNQSHASALKWYIDQSSGELTRPWVISWPISYWRAFSLAWSLWLVTALFSWLKSSVEKVKGLAG